MVYRLAQTEVPRALGATASVAVARRAVVAVASAAQVLLAVAVTDLPAAARLGVAAAASAAEVRAAIEAIASAAEVRAVVEATASAALAALEVPPAAVVSAPPALSLGAVAAIEAIEPVAEAQRSRIALAVTEAEPAGGATSELTLPAGLAGGATKRRPRAVDQPPAGAAIARARGPARVATVGKAVGRRSALGPACPVEARNELGE